MIFVKPRIPESQPRHTSGTSPAGGEQYRITVRLPGKCSVVNETVLQLHPLMRSLPSQDEDLEEMRQSGAQMDQQYGHWVDRVLVKEDMASACAELRGILERLEREPSWVPVSWLRT